MSEPNISITWNGAVFVLAHTNQNGTSTYKYSIDGENWELAEVPDNILTTNQVMNAKWVNNRVMLMGNLSTIGGNVLLSGYDGKHYSIVPQDGVFQIRDIETNAECYNTIRFPRMVHLSLGNVLLDNGTTTISYSLNAGAAWTPANSSNVFSVCANDAKWNGRIWVAVGNGDTNTIATSSDGIKWVGRGKYIFMDGAYGVDWSKESHMWVAVGSDESGKQHTAAYSMDGVYWLGVQIPGFQRGLSVRWNGEIWVAAGIPDLGTGRSIAYSIDGETWESVPNMFSVKATNVNWDGVNWSVYGEDPAGNIATSSDGKKWTLRNYTNLSLPAFYDNTQYWKSSGNTYSTSFDGDNWTAHSTITDMSLSSVNQFSVNSYNDGVATIYPMTIATGEGQNTLAYSYDGIYWVGLGKTIFSERANNAVWNGTIWVAVGKGTYWVATSYDGLEWTGRESSIMTEGYDIAWNGTRFVAVGVGNSPISTSLDGIVWIVANNTTGANTFTKVRWTGKRWLAYCDSVGTTMSDNGTDWGFTPDKNATMFGSSIVAKYGYFTGPGPSTSNASNNASTSQTGYETYLAFNNTYANGWRSSANKYVSSSGVYSGSESTTYTSLSNITQSANGEWLQFSINPSDYYNPPRVISYSITFSTNVADTTAIPREWVMLGSTDGANWHELHSFSFQPTTPPNNTWKTPRFTLPIVINNAVGYGYYRFVVKSTFGETFASIIELDLYEEQNIDGSVLSRYETPISLKNNVVFRTNAVSFADATTPTYRLADLSLNTLEQNPTNAGLYVNSAIYGLSQNPITSVCTDGEYTFISDILGVVTLLTNDAENSHLNFDTVVNGATINTQLSEVYSSCWNQSFVLFGGLGGISYGRIDAGNQWILTNASDLFTTVYGLASNSGYGFVYIPNALYLHTNDKLRVVGPKSQMFTGETAIRFNLLNSNKR
jgi:hypothetical protein